MSQKLTYNSFTCPVTGLYEAEFTLNPPLLTCPFHGEALASVDTGITIILEYIYNITAAQSPYTIDICEGVVNCNTTAGNITLNLRTAVGYKGKIYTIQITAGGNEVTIIPFDGEKINGASSYSLPTAHSNWVNLVSDGANWSMDPTDIINSRNSYDLTISQLGSTKELFIGKLGGNTLAIRSLVGGNRVSITPSTNDLILETKINDSGTSNQDLWSAAKILTAISSGGASRSQSSQTRTFNTIYQPSTTNDTFAIYSASIGISLTLLAGASGSIVFEISPSSTFASGVQTVSSIVGGQSGSLALGLNLAQTTGGNLVGYVPKNYYARLRTVTTTGSPTFTYSSGQEISL